MLDRDAAVEASRRMNAELGGLQIELAAMLWAKWAVGAHTLQLQNGQVLGVAILQPTPAPRLESTSQESFCSWQLPSGSRSPVCCTS
jgi:hypothetical protein